MKIWINRAGQNLGTFTLEEVQRGLDQSRFVPTDLGWQEGMETWKPLGEFPGLQMQPQQVPTASLAPVAPSSPEVPPPLGEDTLATAEGVEDGLAWDRLKELGFVKALTQTWKEVLFDPSVSFTRMKTSGGFASPFLFNLTMTVIYILFRTFNQMLTSAIPGWPGNGSNSLSGISPGMVQLANVLVLLVLLPLSVAWTFVQAGIFHLCLALFKGTSKSYESTYRATCYSSSTYIFAIVPWAGEYVVLIWWVVLSIIGLSKVHRTEGWRATMAVLLPVFICIGTAVVLVSAAVISYLHHANT